MINIYSQITLQFDFLKNHGLVFNCTESNGKLKDRNIRKFTYSNPVLGKKFEIVYCVSDSYTGLYGFIVKSGTTNIPHDPQSFIPFNRLRCLFGEGSGIIFFGAGQNELSYKLKEFKLIMDKFLPCVATNDWVDYAELLSREKKIYALSLEPQNYYGWVEEIKANGLIKNFTGIIFDAIKKWH